MTRGDVWTSAMGSGFGSKPRPVIIIQGDEFGETPNVLVALCQTATGESDEIRPRMVPDIANNLQAASDIAVEILVAVPRSKFGYRVGKLIDADMARVDIALLTILGFSGR